MEKEEIVAELKKLAKGSGDMGVTLPENEVGLPSGDYILGNFLMYIATNLDEQ